MGAGDRAMEKSERPDETNSVNFETMDINKSVRNEQRDQLNQTSEKTSRIVLEVGK